MKKITAILLMALMVLSLTACGNQTGKDNNGSEGSTEPTSVTITTLNGTKQSGILYPIVWAQPPFFRL